MLTVSLLECVPPESRLLSPTYTAVPQAHEYRLALNPRLRPNRLPCSFVKQTKSGNLGIRLVGQDEATLPVYGFGASVQGAVEISKTEGITSVEVQVEGILDLEEVAEGGTSTVRLFLNKSMLWVKDRAQRAPCPNSLQFSFSLPTTYLDGEKMYFLPPSFQAHLSGFPGFHANVRYSVSAIVVKPNDVSNLVNTLFRRDVWAISTPFVYLPRTRPPVSIPAPLPLTTALSGGFAETTQWKLFSSTTKANRRGMRELVTKLYIPSTRVFCLRRPIPFHLSFHSDVDSLLGFLPLAPVAGLIAPKRRATRIQLMRQISVDARNALTLDTKTNIWRVDCIGEGAFRESGIGAVWVAFSGDIFISDEVTVGGFRASGFIVRDYLVLTMTPPDPLKSPFKDLRMVIPVRLTTDRWNDDGTGLRVCDSGSPSVLSSEELAATPELLYTS